MSSGARTSHRLGQLRPGIVQAGSDCAQRAAHTHRLVDGGARASAQTAQRESLGTKRIRHRAPTSAARAFGHSQITAESSVRTDGRAVEPRLIEELAGLYVESDGDRLFFAERVGRWTAAVAATEVAHHAFVRNEDGTVMVKVVVVTTVLILGSSERGERDQQENCEDGHDARRAALRMSMGRIMRANPG